MQDVLPGTEQKKTFTIQSASDSTVAVQYAISLEITKNTFTAESNDLVYSLSGEAGGDSAGKVVTSKTNEIIPGGSQDTISLGTGTIGSGGKTHTYTFTIRFREMGSNQNSNQGKEFAGSLKVTTSGENGSSLYYTSSYPSGTTTEPSSDDAGGE